MCLRKELKQITMKTEKESNEKAGKWERKKEWKQKNNKIIRKYMMMNKVNDAEKYKQGKYMNKSRLEMM